MDESTKLIGFLATAKQEMARTFFRDVLNLPLKYEDDYAIVFETGNTTLRIQKVGSVSPPEYTSFGWEVENISREVKELKKKGVIFLRFPGMHQDELGIWTAPSNAKIAWFNDPDGHILSLTQM